MIKKIRLLLLILTLFLITYLIYGGYLANASMDGGINNSLKEYLKTYDISFLIKTDLNNDGREEKVTIYRQWDGEGWWSDDQWYIICIFDEDGDILYKRDVSYFQEVSSFAVKDSDGDGLKEIILSLDPAECWDAKTQIYGWEKGSYKFIGEFKSGDNTG